MTVDQSERAELGVIDYRLSSQLMQQRLGRVSLIADHVALLRH